MQTKRLMIGTLVLAAAFSMPAQAEETQCTGTLGAVGLDNIFVPDGASCVLERTRANGSIVVGRGATLIARSVSVNGNIQAEGAASVRVLGFSTVGGSVQLVQGGGAVVRGARINGDLYVDSNVALLRLNANNIGGNLQAFQNLGGLEIANNTIKGNLQCKANEPAPTGGANSASSKEDQCENL
jgi:hypothetical protein